MCEICSKLTIQTLERRHITFFWCLSFLNRFCVVSFFLHCWIWTSKWRLGKHQPSQRCLTISFYSLWYFKQHHQYHHRHHHRKAMLLEKTHFKFNLLHSAKKMVQSRECLMLAKINVFFELCLEYFRL